MLLKICKGGIRPLEVFSFWGCFDMRQAAKAQTESCEIIELAIDQVDLLTRAFNLISEACQQPDRMQGWQEPLPPEESIN